MKKAGKVKGSSEQLGEKERIHEIWVEAKFNIEMLKKEIISEEVRQKFSSTNSTEILKTICLFNRRLNTF